jgi:DNA-directed RNA polymerase subunit RPC12/RpoP
MQEDCDKHFKEHHHEKEMSKTLSCPQCSYKTGIKTLFSRVVIKINNTKTATVT